MYFVKKKNREALFRDWCGAKTNKEPLRHMEFGGCLSLVFARVEKNNSKQIGKRNHKQTEFCPSKKEENI